MSLHRNIWHPDTCGCEVEFEFDDEHPHDRRVHTLHRIHQKCQHHAHLTDDEVWAAVGEENPRKNRALGELQHAMPHLFMSEVDTAVFNRQLVLNMHLSADQQAFLDALTDEEVRAALVAAGLPAVVAGQPVIGLTIQHEFEPSQNGKPRRLRIKVPHLSGQWHQAAKAHLTSVFGEHVELD